MAQMATLVDQIARSTHDRNRLVIGDAVVDGDTFVFENVTGGAIHQKLIEKQAALDRYKVFKADEALFAHDLKVVKEYYEKLAAVHAAEIRQRDQLLAQIAGLEKRLAAVRAEQNRRVEARSAATGTAANR